MLYLCSLAARHVVSNLGKFYKHHRMVFGERTKFGAPTIYLMKFVRVRFGSNFFLSLLQIVLTGLIYRHL